MKIRGNKPVSGAYSPARPGRATPVDGVAPAAPPRGPAAAASIMGIPEAELTPGVRTAMVALMDEVDTLRSELEMARRRIEELSNLADQDALLPEVLNRRAFIREMSRLMSFAERYDMEASLVYFDLNGFKQVNDKFGHAAGDDVLRKVGEILLSRVRESDIVGRLGGDEFAVVLAKANQEVALTKATDLAKHIQAAQVPMPDGSNVSVGTSFGAYTFQEGVDVVDAMNAADQAMYKTKPDTSGDE